MYGKLLFKMTFVLGSLLVLTGCNGDIVRGLVKDPSYYTDGAILETYTNEGEYIGQLDEMVFQIKVEDSILKFETQIEDREILKGLKQGDPVTITYSGPPNIDLEYLLEEVIVH